MTEMKRNGTVETVAIWLSVVVSFTTLGVLIWKGGALAQTVETDTLRIAVLENQGSSRLRAHEESDNERVNALKDRVSILERVVSQLSDMQADLREIKVKVNLVFSNMGFDHKQGQSKSP